MLLSLCNSEYRLCSRYIYTGKVYSNCTDDLGFYNSFILVTALVDALSSMTGIFYYV